HLTWGQRRIRTWSPHCGWPRSYPFHIDRDRRKCPYVALGDYIRCCRLIFFEPFDGYEGIERCGVVPDFKQHDVVRIFLRYRDTELASARLLHCRSTQLLDDC